MDVVVAPVSVISSWRDNWNTRVKVLCLWEESRVTADAEYRLLQMVLMDEDRTVDYDYLIDFIGILIRVERQKNVDHNGKMLIVLTIEVFADGFNVALQHFSRLNADTHGNLICNIEKENFDWRMLRTIENLKSNTEDGQFFVLGKIREIIDDPEWWCFGCVCGHRAVADENVFHCESCVRDVEHVTTKFRVKIIVEDGTSDAVFSLMDNAATKLFQKTCSSAFFELEDEVDGAVETVRRDIFAFDGLRNTRRRLLRKPRNM
ncbi:hypothetical protein PIB30_093070 [Stylosanthes scabra]|uniref:Replication factor A C-terminal domain-containing protein n=1 Tax=Stylosanthes scabra TaxID=79078 RepID=A0ABU6YXT3_9FABA|nr:hypothetical protein [Stylosanthes scabra]